MNIDIISDLICPWCFIGKRRLERALAARPDLDVAISWRAYQLNPEMPPEGMDRAEYLAVKFGSPERAREIYGEIAAAGASEGIDFAFDRIGRTPNTINAHRLIRLAAEKGLQHTVVDLLFRRYFLDGVDLGDDERLVEVAGEAGFDTAEVSAYLASDSGRDAIRLEEIHARRLGVTGVPCFIIDQRFAVSGAQAPEVFVRIFETAEQALATGQRA
ncbi:MAG: DsbA family oxidoreductase [Alphaproteobacteria bacterium]